MMVAPALMDISVSIPVSCAYTVYFSEALKPQAVDEIASLVRLVYSRCKIEDVKYQFKTQISDEKIEAKIDLSTSIRTSIPSVCKYTFGFSEETFLTRLDDAASFVSDIYSKFSSLTLEEKIGLSKSHLNFSTLHQLATEDEINMFKKALKDRIILDLTKSRSITLSTDNGPMTELREVASSVFKRNSQWGALVSLFPTKTCTRIHILENEIQVNTRFATII